MAEYFTKNCKQLRSLKSRALETSWLLFTLQMKQGHMNETTTQPFAPAQIKLWFTKQATVDTPYNSQSQW